MNKYDRIAGVIFWTVATLAVAAVFYPPLWPVPVVWAILATTL